MFREFDYDNKPVVEIVDEMLQDAVKNGVSDIHFDPTPDILNVRFRIDGELREYAKVPASVKKNLLTRVKIISGMNITETTIPFDLPTKWNKQEFEEVLYYCRADVNALFPLFERLINSYKSKFTICKIGSIDPQYGLGMTDANLTATLLGAERQEHDDPFLYEYPEQIQKDKIPQEALDYFDDLITHNDLNYKREAPCLDLKTIEFQLGVGGCHGFSKNGTYSYDRGDGLTCG